MSEKTIPEKEFDRRKGVVLYTSWRAVVIILGILTSFTIITVFAISDLSTNNTTNTDNTTDNNNEYTIINNRSYDVEVINTGFSMAITEKKGIPLYCTEGDIWIVSYLVGAHAGAEIIDIYVLNEANFIEFNNSQPFTAIVSLVNSHEIYINVEFNVTGTYFLAADNPMAGGVGLTGYFFFYKT